MQEVPGRRLDIGLAHQRLADQEAADAEAGHLREVLPGREAAFGDDDPVGRHAAGQPGRGAEVGFEGVEVAVVDAEEAGLQPAGALTDPPFIPVQEQSLVVNGVPTGVPVATTASSRLDWMPGRPRSTRSPVTITSTPA